MNAKYSQTWFITAILLVLPNFLFGYPGDYLDQPQSSWTANNLGEGVSPTEPSVCESSVEKAVNWLLLQKSPNWSFNNNTPDVLLALQLAPYTEVNQIPESTLETKLYSKQLEVEILETLWRHHEVPFVPSKLAKYSLALNTFCLDPRQFHEHNLIATLLHHEPQRDADFALTALAACSAQAHVRKRQIRRLLDIANAASDHNIDTVALVILALKCIVQDHKHRNFQHFLRRPTLSLARQQLEDGSFGNLHSTSLAIQALQNEEFGVITHNQWNRTAAVTWLIHHQNSDGAFGDLQDTADAVLALSWRGLSAIRNLECGHSNSNFGIDNHDNYDGSYRQSSNHLNDSDPRNVTVTYTLWVGTNITENFTQTLLVPRNISFYYVMQLASEQDSHFAFEASEWPNGHYVHTIASYKEEPMGYHYWLLYRTPTLPDPSNPPMNQWVAPGGVDDLLVDNGEHYLFWYKKL